MFYYVFRIIRREMHDAFFYLNSKTMKTNLITKALRIVLSFDGIFFLLFGIIFVIALVSVIAGAWWHIYTCLASFVICLTLFIYIRRKIKNEDS